MTTERGGISIEREKKEGKPAKRLVKERKRSLKSQ